MIDTQCIKIMTISLYTQASISYTVYWPQDIYINYINNVLKPKLHINYIPCIGTMIF